MARQARDSKRREPQSRHGGHAPSAASKGSAGRWSPSQKADSSARGTTAAPSQASSGSHMRPPMKLGDAPHSKRTVVDAGSTDKHKSTER